MPISADILIPLIGTLMGTIIGAWITYLATTAAENQRWQRQKRDKLAEARQEAVKKGLAWIDPMQLALDLVRGHIGSLLRFQMDEDTFLERFPRIGSDMAKLDVSPDTRILLPGNVYTAGMIFVQHFEDLRPEAIGWSQRARMENKPMLGYLEMSANLHKLQQEIDELHTTLKKAYIQTFE